MDEATVLYRMFLLERGRVQIHAFFATEDNGAHDACRSSARRGRGRGVRKVSYEGQLRGAFCGQVGFHQVPSALVLSPS